LRRLETPTEEEITHSGGRSAAYCTLSQANRKANPTHRQDARARALPASTAIIVGNHRIDIDETGRNAGIATARLLRDGQDPQWPALADYCVAGLDELLPA